MELPAAQFGEAKLEDIVKISQAGEHAKLPVAGGSNASGCLLRDYDGLERAKINSELLPSVSCVYYPPLLHGGNPEHCPRGRCHCRDWERPKSEPCAIVLWCATLRGRYLGTAAKLEGEHLSWRLYGASLAPACPGFFFPRLYPTTPTYILIRCGWLAIMVF